MAGYIQYHGVMGHVCRTGDVHSLIATFGVILEIAPLPPSPTERLASVSWMS